MGLTKEDKIRIYANRLKEDEKYNSKYINKNTLKRKIKNSQIFTNIKCIRNDGIIELKTNDYACVLELEPIDLSLSNQNEQNRFFNDFKEIYKIKDLKMKCYKIDKKLNLNLNKENYINLMNKLSDDKNRLEILNNNYNLLVDFDENDETLSSSYYFVLISNNIETLNRQLNELEAIANNIIPKVFFELLRNRMEIYSFLNNLYLSNSNLEQLLWLDLPELLCPTYLQEKTSSIKINDEEIQMVVIKNLPKKGNFEQAMFFNQIFNIPKVRGCININESVDIQTLINRLDRNYGSLLSDRITAKKLSDATELDNEKVNYQILMNDIKNGDEKIKEVSIILVLSGTKKEKEEIYRYIKNCAESIQIKVEIPRLRQMEAWQCFDITGFKFKDYINEFPSLTLSAGFPFTETHFNDYKGYLLGYDKYTNLPLFFDPYYLNKKTRTSHNIAIVASTGGGKSFAIKKIIVNEFARKTKIFIIDPEGEYENLVKLNGGEYIDLYSRKNGIINPLQIRYTSNNDENQKDLDPPLPKHLGFLENFFKCTFEDIREVDRIMLMNMVEALYNKKGINKNTTIEELEKLKNTDYPTLSDLYKFIPEFKENEKSGVKRKVIEQLEILLSRFLTGTDAYLFDGYTTIDFSNDLIAFNLRELLYADNDRLVETQVINLLTYLSNAIVSNKINNDKLDKEYKKSICIVADEFHLFTNEKHIEILRNFGQLARRIRKYTGSLIVASQSIDDFVGNSDILRHSKAIFNNCQYQLVGMLKEADMNAYIELFKENPLTEAQKDFLLKASQGEFLLNITNKKRLRIKIEATPLEVEKMGEQK